MVTPCQGIRPDVPHAGLAQRQDHIHGVRHGSVSLKITPPPVPPPLSVVP